MKNVSFEGNVHLCILKEKKMFEESSVILKTVYDSLSEIILNYIPCNYFALSTPIIGLISSVLIKCLKVN